ncbi:type VII secretion protein EccC [Nakamurella lactea]|uniref:type VII secretion protein EccC n=1 Tax=Nakamurella lactea TaxID=459515 RepID=UPI00040A550C|nr:type VII secretion protein EccC [Nakamurella lactea]
MAQRLIHRPARHRPPDADLRPVELIPAPVMPDGGAGMQGAMQILMPIMGGAGSLVMIVANKNPVMLIAGGIMLVVTVLGAILMFIGQRTGATKRAHDMRRRYLEYLERVRAELGEAGKQQREIAEHHHPPMDALVDVARDPLRLWERRPSDADFLTVRVGTGSSPLWQRVAASPSHDPLSEPDIVTAAAVHRIVERDRMVGGMPVAVPISGRVTVVGPTAMVRDTVTAALAQLVTLHGPEEVRLFAVSPRRNVAWLDWLKWMPHALSDEDVDGTAPKRMVASDLDELGELIRTELSRRVGELTRSGRMRANLAGSFGYAMVIVVDAAGGKAPDVLAGIPPEISPGQLGVHCITLADSPANEPERVDVRVSCDQDGVQVRDLRPAPNPDQDKDFADRNHAKGAPSGVIDRISPAMLQALSRELTAVRLVEESAASAPLEATLTLGDLVGVSDPGTFDPRRTWGKRTMPDFLNVPFGLGPSGEKVHLDIKENALGGMGPHGLCVGATGSGKSEVLRTIVLCLAINHPPERLAMVLVDYKGGATFAGLEDTPHCAAMISNLSDDDGLVDRLHDALFGEMKRRQQVLAKAGNLPNVTEYNRRRDAGEPLDPLPNLFVVIDEFGELLTAKPDFIELFLAIGRIGRSIGVHLMLASQRLEEGRLRGLESYLSYRLGLRTFNAQESRTVLGVPDAYELPPIPGSGYLAVDTTVFQRFKAGYVSGTYKPPATGETVIDTDPVVAPFPLFNDTAAYLASIKPPSDDDEPAETDEDALLPTVLDVAVRQMAAVGTRTTQIWLPPLPKRLDLDTLTGPVRIDPVRGLRVDLGGDLKVPIGLLDKPAEQKQEPYLLDLATTGGHLAIIGAPQTGKSVLLRTIMIAAGLTHLPGEVAFYCLDLGGGALRILDGLPHVAGVATRLDGDRVRRTVAEVMSTLVEREELFGRLGIDSVEQMRERHRSGRLPESPVADVFLVIDNWPVLRSDFDDLADLVQDLGTRGPGYGIHLIMTMGRWSDVRTQLQAAIGTKIELRINDPIDSVVARKASENLRADTPGRAIIEPGLQLHICLPTLADDRAADPALAGDGPAGDELGLGLPEPTELSPEQERAGLDDELSALEKRGRDNDGDDEDQVPLTEPARPGGGAPDGGAPTEKLIAQIAAAWQGDPVPVIRMLPALVDYASLVERAGDRKGVVIGVDEAELKPVELDLFGADPHLMVFGDSESGKTSLLRVIVNDLIRKYSDQQVVFAVFDIRRTLLDVVPEDYLGAYAGTTSIAAPTAAAVAAEIHKRLPPDDVTAAQLRNRSWWQGTEVVVIADDYDLLSPGGAGPLAPFLEYLPQSRDLGLHLILCRRSGGASRSMYEQVPQRMQEVGATGLLLSGDRMEGQLFPGAYMSVQPPGRGLLVRRGRKPQLIQLAYRPEDHL